MVYHLFLEINTINLIIIEVILLIIIIVYLVISSFIGNKIMESKLD